MSTFASQIINFNRNLNFTGKLPAGIRIMNPFRENPEALSVSEKFYRKFYSDNKKRRFIIGINPGRFGAGVTGVPFTDPKRLKEKCGIELKGVQTHEPSSVFVYRMIDAYGGPEKFYKDFYINAICPLGFTAPGKKGEVNYNYYDRPDLQKAVLPFILDCMKKQLRFGLETETAYCLGTGKNFKFVQALNKDHKFFGRIIPLEHPRFVIQYRLKRMDEYVEKYLAAFKSSN